jgi:hypothetical protein
MIKVFHRFIAVGLLQFLVLAEPAPAEPNYWALVVGVDKYTSSSVSSLKYAGADARLFADTLVKSVKYPEANVFVYTTDDGRPDWRPTAPNLIHRLDWLKANAGPDDTIVFFFAGHGVSQEGETYLLTQEADSRSSGTLMYTSLKADFVYQQLGRSKAKNSLVLLDACRNDPTAGGRGDSNNVLTPEFSRSLIFTNEAKPGGLASLSQDRNLATLFACKEGERSYEWTEKQHGFFTYFLVDALQKAADKNGNITLQSISEYLQTQVRETSLRHASSSQSPMLRYEGPGPQNWVLRRSNAPLGAAPLDPAVLEQRYQAERAQRQAAEARAKIAEENAAKSENQKLQLELDNRSLQAQMALLEMQRKAGVGQSQDVEKLKQELESAKQSLSQCNQALALAESQAEAARKKRDEAEGRAQQLAQTGQSLEADKARAEAKESNLVLLAEKARAEEARRIQVEAENQALQKRLALLDVQPTGMLKGNEAAEKLQKELEEVREEMQLARRQSQASEARARAARLELEEAETRRQAAQSMAQASSVQNPSDPQAQKELAFLRAETEKYKQLLAQAERGRQEATQGVLSAESDLASSQAQFQKKWKRVGGSKNPNGKGRLMDILKLDSGTEAQELPPAGP